MGYSVHVRRDGWWEGRNPITSDEWNSYILNHPEFVPCGHLGGQTMHCWSEHKDFPSFLYFNGDIEVQEFDLEICRKLLEMAAFFGAVVQGDELEVYAIEDNELAYKYID